MYYFNSQPHKEADADGIQKTFFVFYFNSQPHKEADGRNYLDPVEIGISTHSLTRRLTDNVLTSGESEKHFNSQPHKEADGRFLYV